MQLYLAKPGGLKSGPFSLEQVQQDLATGKYRDSDFWAWHEGLANWMPLYDIPGVHAKPLPTKPAPVPVVSASKPEPKREPEPKPEPEPAAASLAPITVASKSSPGLRREPEPEPELKRVPEPEPKPKAERAKPAAPVHEAFEASTQTGSVDAEPAVVEAQEPAAQPRGDNQDVTSGLPFAALEQIFIFTTGPGRAVFESPIVIRKLQEAVGQGFDDIRGKVFVDVIGNVDVGFELMVEGLVPDKAWRAMTAVRPFLAGRAREGAYQICIRPFSMETHDSVALFLLYDREKCECAAV